MTSISDIDLHHLTAEQAGQLRFVLSQFSLHHLIQLAALVRQIADDPGFGSISITIEKRHLNTIEGGQRKKFLAVLDAEQLSSLMDDAK